MLHPHLIWRPLWGHHLSHRRLQTRQPSPLPWLVDAVVAAFTSSMAASRKATMDAAMAVLESSLTPRSGVLQSYDDGGKNGNDSITDRTTDDRRATKDRTTKDRTTKDRTTKDRTTKDRTTKDRTTKDRTMTIRTTTICTTTIRTTAKDRTMTNRMTTTDRTTKDRTKRDHTMTIIRNNQPCGRMHFRGDTTMIRNNQPSFLT
jgi:hypothetical protein